MATIKTFDDSLEHDAIPTDDSFKIHDVTRKMDDMKMVSKAKIDKHDERKLPGSAKFVPPNFKGFPSFSPFMSQNLTGAGTVNAIQIGHANNIHMGNVMQFSGCSFGPDLKTPKESQQKKDIPKKKLKLPEEIRTNKSEVTIEMMRLIKNSNLGYKWKSLGDALSLPDGLLDEIDYDYRGHGLGEFSFQVVRKWKERIGEEATVGKLAEALADIGCMELAIKLVQIPKEKEEEK